jgi:transcriptional regulator with XRE-family HTH domain
MTLPDATEATPDPMPVGPSAEPLTPHGDTMPQVSAAIRRLRAEQKISLQELSNRAGVSVGMLSQIERGIANPSLKLLTRIRQALGTPIGGLFDENAGLASDADFVRRSGHRPMLDLGYVTKELLSPNLSQSLQFMLLHIPPGGSSGERLINYPADKGGLILQGKVLLRVGDVEAELRVGDSFMFDSRKPHGFRNASDAPCQVLWIIGAMPIEWHL